MNALKNSGNYVVMRTSKCGGKVTFTPHICPYKSLRGVFSLQNYTGFGGSPENQERAIIPDQVFE
jgi:hypothetical protein